MPTSTDPRIEELRQRIRVLCCEPLTEPVETELRELATELRNAITEHVGSAKSSLSTKNSAIMARDPDQR